MNYSRRAVLSGTAATMLGLAGCAALGSEEESSPAKGGTPTGTSSSTPTDEPPSHLYSGPTIPEQPSAGPEAIAPLAGGPHPEVDNPVITGEMVTDFGEVRAVADPFLFVEEGTFHLFFEIMSENRDRDAVIGHATSSDGLDWEYDQVVLAPGAHVSWPYVWKWDGEYYMAPDSGTTVELYRAKSFPTGWERVATPLDAEDFFPHDGAIVRWDDRWWLFVGRPGEEGNRDSQTMAFHSETLEADDWTPHAANPIVSGRERGARPGGRPVSRGDDRYLFFQDSLDTYGDKVRAFRVTELTTETYADEEVASSPVASEFGIGYNANGMHTYDAWYLGEGNGWLCAVDGKRPGAWTGIGFFHVPEPIEPKPGAVPVDRDAALYYRFDGGSAVAVDDSGNEKHGMIRGTKPADGAIEGGRRFPNDTDRIIAPYDMDDVLSGEFTVLAYAAAGDASTAQTLCDYTKRSSPNWVTVSQTSDGEWRAHYSTANGEDEIYAPVSESSGLEQVALVAGEESTRLFVDGTEQAKGEAAQAPQINNYFTIGADLHGKAPWAGTVARFGVLPGVLSKSQLERVDERVRGEN